MMMVRSRTFLAAFTAYAILLVFAAEALPSYDAEAGRKHDVARQRLADLKKSKKRQRYRSYWMDCLRTFELVEKKYPRSPSAGDACLDRAGLFLDLFHVSRHSRDKNDALKVYTGCQSAYPRHPRAPEALFRMIGIYLDENKDAASANKVYAKLLEEYPDSAWTGRAKTRLGLNGKSAKKEPELRKPPAAEIGTAAKPADPASPGTVKGIRQWSSEAYTRIVIDLDRPLRKFESHELKEPDRLVFDLQGARMDEALSKEPLVLNNGILRQVRSSQYSPDTVRVVLDLASIKSYAAFPLHDPDRLVIDVSGEVGAGAAVNASTPEPARDGTANASAVQPPAPTEQNAAPQVPQAKIAPPAQKPETNANDGKKLSLSEQMGLKVRKIAIDAGHGGHDPGAIGKYGLKEKNVTLDIAKRLAKLVREQLDCEVIMTRDKDVYIDLDKRPFIAKSNHADLFVSIHVNANRKRSARGIETYIQSIHASDRDAMATAARENAMTTRTISQLGNEIDKIMAKIKRELSDQSKDDDSVYLANYVQQSLVNNLKPVNKYALDLDVKRAFFYVLINTEMPSILAEVGFISNPEEEKLLKREAYRQRIAEALFKGVKRYVDARNPQVVGI